MVSGFCAILRKAFSTPGYKINLPMFSSSDLIISFFQVYFFFFKILIIQILI